MPSLPSSHLELPILKTFLCEAATDCQNGVNAQLWHSTDFSAAEPWSCKHSCEMLLSKVQSNHQIIECHSKSAKKNMNISTSDSSQRIAWEAVLLLYRVWTANQNKSSVVKSYKIAIWSAWQETLPFEQCASQRRNVTMHHQRQAMVKAKQSKFSPRQAMLSMTSDRNLGYWKHLPREISECETKLHLQSCLIHRLLVRLVRWMISTIDLGSLSPSNVINYDQLILTGKWAKARQLAGAFVVFHRILKV